MRAASKSRGKTKSAASPHNKPPAKAGKPSRTKQATETGTAETIEAGFSLGQLPDFIGYPLRRAQIAVFDDFMRLTGAVGLRPGQFSTLLAIDTNPGSKQTDIAAALGIQGTNFVAMVNHLEERGLIERRAFDRRSYALHLTPTGKALLERALAIQLEQEKSYEEILGPGGRQLLLGLLARLMAGLEDRHRQR
jgi:DNA-binding MarR family transcriptional regulator